MSTSQHFKSYSSFFFYMGLVGVAAVLVGFGRTFLIPIASGTRTWPTAIYIHGAFATSWVGLYLLQTLFVRKRKVKWHMRAGKAGIFIAICTAFSIIPAALYQVDRELAAGLGQVAISSLLGGLTSASIFLLLVIAGVAFRKKREIHKRLMLLATLVLIWPAWFRWRHYFPSVERPDIWFGIILADSMIIVAFVWDWLRNKSIHPALLYTGLLFIIENIIEILLFDTPVWRAASDFLYTFLN